MERTVAALLVVVGLLAMHGLDAHAVDHWMPGGHVRLHVVAIDTAAPVSVATFAAHTVDHVRRVCLATVDLLPPTASIVPRVVLRTASRSTISLPSGPEAPPP